MSVPIPSVATLPSDVQDILLTGVKPKFDAYFDFTAGANARAIAAPDGAYYYYPEQSMISDLVFLWSVFSDVHQALDGHDDFANFVKADALLLSDVRAIVEGAPSYGQDGSFWHFPAGQVPLEDATDSQLGDVLKTLRNGFAHSHWLHEDLSAIDYWRKLHWSTERADSRFNLGGRPSNNYAMYIADAWKWDSARFWTLDDLRILVTPSHILRHHLHLMLNYILNGSRATVFEN